MLDITLHPYYVLFHMRKKDSDRRKENEKEGGRKKWRKYEERILIMQIIIYEIYS